MNEIIPALRRVVGISLAANIKMALFFSAFGSVIPIAWLVMERRWSRRR